MPCSKITGRKLSWIAIKPRKFSPSKFSHCTVYYNATICMLIFAYVGSCDNSWLSQLWLKLTLFPGLSQLQFTVCKQSETGELGMRPDWDNRHLLVSGEQPSTETWIWLYTYRVVGIETQSKVPQGRKQFRFYHPGKEGTRVEERGRETNGIGSHLYLYGRFSPCDGIVHALVDSGQMW